MRLFVAFLFLTLVGTSLTAGAAPNTAPHKPERPSARETPPPPPGLEKTETTGWSDPSGFETIPVLEPSSPPLIERTARAPYDLQAQIGWLDGNVIERDKTAGSAMLGALLSWADREERAWDFHLAVTEKNWVRGGVGRRFALSNFETWSAPYWKIDLSQTVESSRFFGGLVDLETVKATAAFGFADLFEQRRRWTAELGVGWGLIGFSFHVQAGWNWNIDL